MQAAIKALETGKVAELEAAVKAAQAAADKAAEDAKAANAEILETLKTLATKTEVSEAADAAQKAIAAVESNNAEALKKAQAEILETLKDYATKKDLKDVADAAQKALDDAQKDNSKALADLDTAVKNAQSKANTAAADATKALADLVKTTKNATDALTQANTNKTAIENALKTLGEGYSAENTVAAAIQAIKGQIGTPNKELGTLDTRLAAIESVLNGVKDDDTKLGLATKVTNIEKQLKDIIGEYTTMVTEVSLVGSAFYSNDLNRAHGENYYLNDDETRYAYAIPLSFTSGSVNLAKDYVFGKEEKDNQTKSVSAANQQKFVKGTTFNDQQTLVVRVNPTNAVLTSASIKLVDSQGNDLDDVLEIGEPKQYTGLITRASKNTGLWTIPVTVKAGIARKDVARIFNDNNTKKFISYAVAVKNTKTQKDAEDRYVASTYDVIVPAAQKFVGVDNIDGVQIWSESTMTKDHPVTLAGAKEFTKDNTGDLVRAKNNETINIKFPANLYGGKVKYFYVVRDDHNTDTQGSDQSELNAWKGYKYDGTAYGKVIAADPMNPGTLKINIGGTSVADDQIGFRIFAINYDGTLASRNGGQSFVVYVGDEQTTSSVSGSIAVTKTISNDNNTGWLALNGKLKDGTSLPGSWSTKVGDNMINFEVAYSKDGKTVAPANTKNSDIKYVKFTCTSDVVNWKDALKAEGKITTLNAKDLVENEINVSLTKVLPTVESTIALMGYKWKAAQKDNGKYTAYVYPEGNTWTSANATAGYKNMTEAINDLKAGTEFTVEGIVWNNDTKKYSNAGKFTTTPWAVTVNKALIDGTTEHKTTIAYNYGKISSEHKNNAGEVVDLVIPVETVQTVFACPLDKTAQSYEWTKYEYKKDGKVIGTADVNKLTYGNGTTVESVNLLKYIIASNKFDGTVFGGNLSALVHGSKAKYAKIEASLLSKESGKPDYFTADVTSDPGNIKFHPVADASNPLKDVESELVIKLTDAFGHEMTYSLPFTVKRAK